MGFWAPDSRELPNVSLHNPSKHYSQLGASQCCQQPKGSCRPGARRCWVCYSARVCVCACFVAVESHYFMRRITKKKNTMGWQIILLGSLSKRGLMCYKPFALHVRIRLSHCVCVWLCSGGRCQHNPRDGPLCAQQGGHPDVRRVEEASHGGGDGEKWVCAPLMRRPRWSSRHWKRYNSRFSLIWPFCVFFPPLALFSECWAVLVPPHLSLSVTVSLSCSRPLSVQAHVPRSAERAFMRVA